MTATTSTILRIAGLRVTLHADCSSAIQSAWQGFVEPIANASEPQHGLRVEASQRLDVSTLSGPATLEHTDAGWTFESSGAYRAEASHDITTVEVAYAQHPSDRGERPPIHLVGALKSIIAVALNHRGALLVHSAAVGDSKRALLAAGVSGAGKSTLATLFDRSEGPLGHLGDELVGLWPSAELLCSTPFCGSEALHRSYQERPWVAGAKLAKTPAPTVTRLEAAEAFRLLIGCVVLPEGPGVAKLEDRAAHAAWYAATTKPWYRLGFVKDRASTQASITAIFNQGEKA